MLLRCRFLAALICLLVAPCLSLQAEEWKRAYLATYPRAGNHWLRALIEEATHVATGSVYIDSNGDDVKHLDQSFPWGGYAAPNGCNGKCRYPSEKDIVVIKTHYPAFSAVPFDLQPAVKIIRIIRYPVDSFWSFYILGKDPSPLKPIPRDFLLKLINSWRTFQEHWDKQANVITIRYEDLYENPFPILKSILIDIGYQVDDRDVERSIAKHPPRGSLYKYKANFSEEDLELINDRLGDLLEKYHY